MTVDDDLLRQRRGDELAERLDGVDDGAGGVSVVLVALNPFGPEARVVGGDDGISERGPRERQVSHRGRGHRRRARRREPFGAVRRYDHGGLGRDGHERQVDARARHPRGAVRACGAVLHAIDCNPGHGRDPRVLLGRQLRLDVGRREGAVTRADGDVAAEGVGHGGEIGDGAVDLVRGAGAGVHGDNRGRRSAVCRGRSVRSIGGGASIRGRGGILRRPGVRRRGGVRNDRRVRGTGDVRHTPVEPQGHAYAPAIPAGIERRLRVDGAP